MLATPEQVRKAEDLIRDVLAAEDLPEGATNVEGSVDGRQLPGVRLKFRTGTEIYTVPAR